MVVEDTAEVLAILGELREADQESCEGAYADLEVERRLHAVLL